MNGGQPAGPQPDLSSQILEYLASHPEAQDTVEGVAEWWLLEQRISHALNDVEAALRKLASEGLLVASQRQDGRTHYRLNREMQPQIKARLEGAPAGRKRRTGPAADRTEPGDRN